MNKRLSAHAILTAIALHLAIAHSPIASADGVPQGCSRADALRYSTFSLQRRLQGRTQVSFEAWREYRSIANSTERSRGFNFGSTEVIRLDIRQYQRYLVSAKFRKTVATAHQQTIVFGTEAWREASPLPMVEGFELSLPSHLGDSRAYRQIAPRRMATIDSDTLRANTQNILSQHGVEAPGMIPIGTMGANNGGSSEVYILAPPPPATMNRPSAIRVWIQRNAEGIIKLRHLDEGAPERLYRDLALYGVARQLTQAATLDGRRFIRVANLLSSDIEHAHRIMRMEYIPGPRLYDVANAIHALENGSMTDELSDVLRVIGIDTGLPRERWQERLDFVQRRLDATRQFYSQTAPAVLGYSRINGIHVAINTGRDGIGHPGGFDPLTGRNAIFDIRNDDVVLVDW